MIEKRKVILVGPAGDVHTDYIALKLVEAYVEEATRVRADIYTGEPVKRWATAIVGESHDPGPGGDDGTMHIPAHLAHLVADDPELSALPKSHGLMPGDEHFFDEESGRVLVRAVANPHHIEPADCAECAKANGAN